MVIFLLGFDGDKKSYLLQFLLVAYIFYFATVSFSYLHFLLFVINRLPKTYL